ncbi:MAG: sortase [Anaerolineales bacterium]|nr:sortase [Anaerolineales bacterium]
MNHDFARSIFRVATIFTIFAVMLSVPGFGTRPAFALTTTVSDAAAGAIPNPPAGLSCTTSLTRTFNINTNLIVSDINIGVNVTHPRRSDVRVTLTSPTGTTVVLISGGGLGAPVVASPDDYNNYDVMLDDASINSLYDNDDDDVAVPFYDRDARPLDALSAFKGEDAFGNWTLSICDTRNGQNGAYNRAELTITSADPNSVSGEVFTDYNDNGVRNQGDVGVGGVLVQAFDSAGAVVAADSTDANGIYTLNIPDGTQVRIEFTNIPSDLRPGAFGVDSGTTVQFVTAPAAGVDLGLSKPDEYCNDNPWLISPCYINGDPLAGGAAASAKTLVSIPYDAYGRQDTNIENVLATGAQIGTTWGLAFQRSTGTVFAGALAKRHAGLGTLGPSGVYAIEMDQATGQPSSPPPYNFIRLDTIIPSDFGDSILGSNAARGLPANSQTPNADPSAWDAIGKAAIGDMDMGTNDDTLWLINLTDQTLYSVFVGIPAATPDAGDVTAYPIALPAGATACPASDVRPWAVEIQKGTVYVGIVCSAESSQNVNNLRAYILSMNETAPAGFSLVVDIPLNYPRGIASNPDGGYPAEWRPWSPVMTSLCTSPCTSQNDLAFEKQIIYPQPILSDIEFDTDGSIIIGLMDRIGHQTGNANFAVSNPWDNAPGNPAVGVTLYNKDTNYTPTNAVMSIDALYEGVSAGDTLRLCPSGASYILENNAACGGISTGGNNSAPAQGPGGGEYYWQDMYPPSTDKNSGTHNEITLGGLLLVPGTNEVAVSVFDPFDLRAGGVAWFNNLTGTRTRAYEVFGIDAGGGSSTFGKAAGLGDIEGFCFAAPIEIGNRVWLDADNDGVQDADEAPISGVTVELYDQSGNLIATAATDSTGAYCFSSGPGTTTGNHIYLIDELNPNSQYEIRIPLSQPALAGLTLTTNDINGNAEDQRDSDGAVGGANAVIPITTGDAGDNNHTFDFGFAGSYSLGNRVWLDDGAGGGIADNGIQDGGEAGIANVVVNLYEDANNDGIPDGAAIATTTTDANGYYRFDNLNAGGYIVEVAASNFNTGNPLFSLASSSVDETNPNLDLDLTDNGIGTTPDLVNGIRSGTVQLGPPGPAEPLNEDAPNGQGAPDANANMTVDFGFVPSYSIGNRVWFDTDNDSARDNGVEVGSPNVTVELYSLDALGNPTLVATTTTDANGYYRFDGLPAGDYQVVLPATNFAAGGALQGYWSSGTTVGNTGNLLETVAALANTDIDDDDNGTLQNAGTFAGAVVSSVATLGPGLTEPTLEADAPLGQGAIDQRANMTVDFGFYRLELGDLVFEDVNNNGTFDAGDVPLQGVRVQLFAENGTTEINVGPDGILGTADDAPGGMLTDVNGNYLFSGLPQGRYIVQATGPVGYTSTIDTFDATDNANPDTNRDDNDNGIGTGAGLTTSAVITLTPGSAGALNNNTVNQNNGSTRNPTMDFGFVQANNGIIKTVTPSTATIGELITYQVVVTIPPSVPGTYNNAQVTDTMDRGLALFDCLSVTPSAATLTTSLAPGDFSAVCANNVTTNDTGTGLPEDVDRQVTFSLGNIVNTGQTDATLTITYRAIVLDIPANRGAATQTVLNNSAVFTWSNGSLGPVSRQVTLIEPDLQIVKSSNTTFVATGTPVDFTLTISHTANSRADAFDVLVTDALPAELDFVTGTLDCNAGAYPATTCVYDVPTRTISAAWATYPRLPAADLVIRFTVTGNALLAPNQTITNVAAVQWTSEPGDQSVPDSFSNPANPFATERFYDPTSPNPVNTIYGDNDALQLNPVAGGGGGGGGSGGRPPTTTPAGTGFQILVTGFAPDIVTPLDVESKPSYSSSNVALEIPSIQVKSDVVGVQLKDGWWDLSWLQNQAGWLEGTAYPTWSGNSVISAHVVNADGKPGVFYRLKFVKTGEYIFVHNSGYVYTYEIVSNEYASPDDIRLLNHEGKSVLTLVTCDTYDMKTKSYLRRVVVKAVLVDVSLER